MDRPVPEAGPGILAGTLRRIHRCDPTQLVALASARGLWPPECTSVPWSPIRDSGAEPRYRTDRSWRERRHADHEPIRGRSIRLRPESVPPSTRFPAWNYLHPDCNTLNAPHT